MTEELIFKIGYIYKIKPKQPKEDNDIYYGSTSRNVYIRMSDHINNFKYNKKNKYNCSSYILFEKYEIDELLIETVEILRDITCKELRSRESFYIKNNNCINIQYKNKETLPEDVIHIEQIEYIIKVLGFMPTTTCLNKNDLNNNFKKLFNECDLYKNKIIKFKLVENISTQKILGHINRILKPYSFKIKAHQKREKGALRTSNKRSFYSLLVY
jgi:hypothetical protein